MFSSTTAWANSHSSRRTVIRERNLAKVYASTSHIFARLGKGWVNYETTRLSLVSTAAVGNE